MNIYQESEMSAIVTLDFTKRVSSELQPLKVHLIEAKYMFCLDEIKKFKGLDYFEYRVCYN